MLDKQIKNDIFLFLGGLIVSTIVWLLIAVNHNPVYDCANYVKETLSPLQNNVLLGEYGYDRPPYSEIEKWCSDNVENWYELVKTARNTKEF